MSSRQSVDLPRPELSPTKHALLQARLQGRGRATAVVRRAHGGDVPLSFAQERLWFLNRLQQGGTWYNISKSLRLQGDLDRSALERALGEVVRRHEALRTVFREADGVPLQVIVPFDGFTLPVEDLSGTGEAEREAEVRRLSTREAAHVFDLTRGPLFRARLLRLGETEHVLLLCMHHIVSDGWSMGVFFRELWALYDAFRDGRSSPLPEPPLQYPDYAAWQRGQPRAETEARHLSYWKEQLAGAPELLELPTDRPRPPVPSFRGAGAPVHVPSGVLERLRALGRGEGATLYMVVLAAFQALLSRYTGSEDVVVGTAIAGRTRREVEELIGFFVNTLVLRTDLSGNPRFREVVGRARETVLGAYEHQEVPFERLVDELRPERSLSHSTLFQVMFQLVNEAQEPDAGRGLQVQNADTEPGTAKFDLSLDLDAHAQGIDGVLEYSTDLFEPGTARRMVEHLQRVLEQVAFDPDARLSELELLGDAERRLVLEEWGRTTAAHPGDLCVHQRFEAQVERTPGAVAVTYDDRSLTYREVDEQANRIANHLRRLGVGPEVRVGLCLARSAELPLAMLGVLKAGGAYVPLDPGYPEERLAWMLADAGISVLLTTKQLADRLPTHGAVVLRLDADRERIAAESPRAPAGETFPEQLAYVIYTSGSTGTPKGVGIPHHALTTHMAWMQRAYPLAAGDRVLQKTSTSFDGSVWEFWAPLTIGATLVVAPLDAHRDPAELVRIVARERITVLQAVPMLLGALLEQPDLGRCATLRRLFCGGEALPVELAARAAAVLRAEVVNLYGPTEATMNSAVHTFSGSETGAAVPIGRPLDSVRARVLDRSGSPVPVGVAGELYVGGAHLARGYLGRPGLTAEKFIPDPFSREPGARLYRTGDKVRWLTDGALEYLGRMDEQVKIRGFRIEPGEVEAVLRREEAVKECVVVARDDASGVPGSRRLVAYVVVAGASTVDPAALRERLRGSVPEYMVPDAVVLMDALPQTPAGKLDRQALPAPEYGRADRDAEEPRSYLEVELIEIWEELLRVDGIGPTQSFFELGGNSFLALRLFAQVNRRLGCDLPVSMLFAGATVRHMADAIQEQKRSAPAQVSPVVPLRPTGSLPRLFCVHSADRRVFGYVNLVRHLGPDQPVFGVQDLGADLSRPVARIASEHVQALRTVQPGGPYYLVGWSFGGFVAYEMASQLEREGEPVAFVGLLDTMSPVVAQRWPYTGDLDLVMGMAGDVAEHMGRPFSIDREELEGLNPDEQLRHVVEALHAQGAAPRNFDVAALRENCQVMRARIRSISGYVPGGYSGPLTLFRASHTTDAYERFFAPCNDEERRTLGWSALSPNPVAVHRVPGSHETLGSEPHVRVLAERMRESLAAARLRCGPGAPRAASAVPTA